MKPTTSDAYKLVHQGSLALAEVEAAGMRIDVKRLDQTIEQVEAEISELESSLKSSDIWKAWKERWGGNATLGSRYQLSIVLFHYLGFESDNKTRTGRAKMDAGALEEINHPFVQDYLRMEKKKKLKTTYLMGVKREVVDGYLHPMFNLNLARSYRSSCDRPNFQNIPIRDKEIGGLIRSCFIPRKDHVLVEVDFGALEFLVACCFWKDEAMLEYASDPTKDIHRDMAAECYLLDDVPKQARFYAKNQFVFPQLYGSYYINCAKNLWNAIASVDLKTNDGDSLYDWLADKGINELGDCDPKEIPRSGTFEGHIKSVEDSFHGRFRQWAERKEKWWKKYLERGWFPLMTGFRCIDVCSRNKLYNRPIQGPAFHLLLWSLIQMVKWQIGTKMSSRVIGQIHDSIVADVHKDELDDWLVKAKWVMTEDVREHWDWVVVPLKVEAEVAETNWFEKHGVDM